MTAATPEQIGEHAIVCFWDHSEFSPEVHVYGITQLELQQIMLETVGRCVMHGWPPSPPVAAALFAFALRDASNGRFEIGLLNAPIGPSQSATMQRMFSQHQAPGGLGYMLVDLGMTTAGKRCEVLTYGGKGLYDADFNLYQTRTQFLEPLLALQEKSQGLAGRQPGQPALDPAPPPAGSPGFSVELPPSVAELIGGAAQAIGGAAAGLPIVEQLPAPDQAIDPAVIAAAVRVMESIGYEVTPPTTAEPEPDVTGLIAHLESQGYAVTTAATALAGHASANGAAKPEPATRPQTHKWDKKGTSGAWDGGVRRTCTRDGCGIAAVKRARGPYTIFAAGSGDGTEYTHMIPCQGA